MKKFLKNVALIAIGTFTSYSSEKIPVPDDINVKGEVLEELLLKGNLSSSDRLSLKQDGKFWLKVSGEHFEMLPAFAAEVSRPHNNQVFYLPMEIKNGFLLMCSNLVKLSGKKKNYAKICSISMNGKTVYPYVDYAQNVLRTVISKKISKCLDNWRSSKLLLSNSTNKEEAMENVINSVNFDIFPKYPMVLNSIDDSNSFANLTSIVTRLFCGIAFHIKDDSELEFCNKLKNKISDHCWESCLNHFNYFCEGCKFGIFDCAKTTENYLKFNQQKESFFTFLSILNSQRKEPCSKVGFSKLVYNCDKKLNKAFFAKQLENPSSFFMSKSGNIYKGLTHKSKLVRDTYAKALLLSTLLHPDPYYSFFGVDITKSGGSESDNKELNNAEVLLTQNYGQAARWLQHIDPKHVDSNDYHSHILTYEEYKNIDLSTIKKSFWVLDKGASYIDLYKTLLIKMTLEQAAFKVNNVEINQREVQGQMVENIVVDIECKKEDLNSVAQELVAEHEKNKLAFISSDAKNLKPGVLEMKTLDDKYNIVDANGIRFVVRSSGFFDLITAFPITLKQPYSESQNNGSVLLRLKDFIDMSLFPNSEQFAVVLHE